MAINSWREIPDDFLIVSGLTHPDCFTPKQITEFLRQIAEVADMIPVGDSIIKESNVPLPDGTMDHGFCGIQFWTTSGCTVYTWDIGKITIVVHSCKDIDYEKVKKFIIKFWYLGDRESFQIKLPKLVLE